MTVTTLNGPEVDLKYKLPPTIESIRDGYQKTFESAAVVSGLLAGVAAQLYNFFKDGSNYSPEARRNTAAQELIAICCYCALFFNIGATISGFIIIDGLGEIQYRAAAVPEEYLPRGGSVGIHIISDTSFTRTLPLYPYPYERTHSSVYLYGIHIDSCFAQRCKYFSLFAIYTPYTIYQYGWKGWGKMILKDGWKYFILAACDVEANFLVVKAYQYTDLLSCMLLDAWAIPVCLFFSWLYMRVRYHWTQMLGVFICIGGLGLLVGADQITNKGWDPLARGKGDAFMIAGATLYGFSMFSVFSVRPIFTLICAPLAIANATEEFLVRKRPLYEVVGQLGLWGFLIGGIQASALEWKQMREVPWNGGIIGLIFAFTIAMIILYTVAPMIYRWASSTYFNLSLLSSDFYGLLFGLFLYKYSPYWLYFVSFVFIIGGLIVYFWHSTPEEQGILDPQAPDYVNKRGRDDKITDEEQGPVAAATENEPQTPNEKVEEEIEIRETK
ncbi:hypothetical protein EST38_g1867 [Candolleomyces aberdarensis]|uniref:DUF914-domain-containing protein n=1 Tax=Candolleomyces aberdarensis TaxID=2316362 RepID=A0A4Q2DW06_9AGAR|nr:hypothetical protein EST38_g1867 [Candolleomyces aberdarensis]